MTVTTDEAADIAGVSPATLRSWVMRGWLEPVRRGAKPLRFRYDDVARCQRDHRPQTWEARHAQARDVWISRLSASDVQR